MRRLFLLFSIFLLAACSQTLENEGIETSLENLVNITQDEYLSIVYENPSELDTIEVKALVSDFLTSIDEIEKQNNASTRSVSTDFSLNVKSKSYFKEENVSSTRGVSEKNLKLPVYEVNVTTSKGTGVVYVSADERNAEVITYIPQAAQDEELFIKSGSAFLVKWAKESSYERLLETENIIKELHDATVAKISKKLGIDESQVTIDNIIDKIAIAGTRATPVNQPSTSIVAMVGPLVKTEWSQNSPYNLSLAKPNAPSTQAHVYTGCAVTAACQLMTAIKPNLTLGGTTIDWDYLSETSKITSAAPQRKLDMLGKLHTWVFNQLGATPRYDSYGYHNATGVSAANQIWFYGNYFNHSENYGSYDPDALLRSFNEGRPSLIRGQGHAWIVDGYIIANKAVANTAKSTRAVIIQYYDMFWHANLGWGGTANGYYKLKPDAHVVFESSGYTFTTEDLSVYPGLYKKNANYNF